jgi:hypothetical protein
MVWVDLDRELRFVQLDDKASARVDLSLNLDVNRPQQPQLALDSDGQLHLVWLDKRGEGLQVAYARLSSDGEVLQGTTALSEADMTAGRVAVVADPLGRTMEVFWSDTVPARPGVWHASLDWAGNVLVPAEVLIPEGLRPAAQVDSQGFVHLAWRTEPAAERPELHYTVYDPQRTELGPTVAVGEPLTQASLYGGPTAAGRFDGPMLGLTEDLVYVGWVVEVRERGLLSAFTFYQSFDQPPLSRTSDTAVLDYPLPEVSASAVHVQGADPTVTGDPQFLPGQPEDQVLAVYTQAQGPRNLVMLQSAAAHLQAGQVVSQDVVSATPGASLNPVVVRDGSGHLHMVWIDTAGFDRYRVIYASTAPQVHKVLNPTTLGEVVSQGLELGFGAVVLLGFLPLYLIWALPGFLLLLVFYLITQEVDLDDRRVAIVLWVAVIIHAVIKMSSAGGAVERLSTGLILTMPWLYAVARWVVPLLISGLAALVMVVYIRRKEHPSLFGSFFVFVLSDALLFTLLYLTPLLLFA